ncbi:unnamed protein product [Calicophoron daubneyi]|uniref:Aminopeptidase P N-terminal domain-containing protein n=1 Tax=Calicophoron daubneyi TaxID=300641 RepID=A0AAV2TKX4_CALDB
MAYHVPYPFHQDSNYFYFTGLNEPNGVLAIVVDIHPASDQNDPEFTHHEHLFLEVRSQESELWDGPSLRLSTAAELTGVSAEPLTYFPNFLKSYAEGAYLWYAPLVHPFFDKKPLNRLVFSEILKARDFFSVNKGNVFDPDPLIDRLRIVKSPKEINLMRAAACATAKCMKSIMKTSHPDISESTLYSCLEFQARSQGLLLGYPPVIAGGDRANTIHYLKNDALIKDGELVLVDVGCRACGYTADVTRTWPVNGCYTPAQRILHEILERVQHKCAAAACPETSLADLHRLMVAELERNLRQEKIIPKTNSLSLVQKICPHHIGHFIGLDIHDTPKIPISRRFEPGMVFPLEPGVYMRPEFGQLGVPKEFLGLGLRIEDDFVINDSGKAERLTEDLPTQCSEIEAIIRSEACETTHGRSVRS